MAGAEQKEKNQSWLVPIGEIGLGERWSPLSPDLSITNSSIILVSLGSLLLL